MRFKVLSSRAATWLASSGRRPGRLAAAAGLMALLTLAAVAFRHGAIVVSDSRPVVGAVVYYSNFAPPQGFGVTELPSASRHSRS